MHNERPRAVILAEGVFRAVSASAFASGIQEQALNKIQEIGSSPVWIYTPPRQINRDFEEDIDRVLASIEDLGENGLLHTRYEDYQALYPNIAEAKKQAIDPMLLVDLDQVIPKIEGNPVFKFSSRYAYGLIELDAKTLEYVKLHKVTYGLQLLGDQLD